MGEQLMQANAILSRCLQQQESPDVMTDLLGLPPKKNLHQIIGSLPNFIRHLRCCMWLIECEISQLREQLLSELDPVEIVLKKCTLHEKRTLLWELSHIFVVEMETHFADKMLYCKSFQRIEVLNDWSLAGVVYKQQSRVLRALWE